MINKSILMPIHPEQCHLIEQNKKHIEIKKTKPKIEVPFKVYIYCTESKSKNLVIRNVKECYYDDWGHLESFLISKRDMEYYPAESRVNGKVIGEFICDKIEELTEEDLFYGMDETCPSRIEEYSCVDIDNLLKYKGSNEFLYGWHISNLKIYEKAKEITDFFTEGECDFSKCRQCKWFDGGNDFNLEPDCHLPYDYLTYPAKPIFKAPQSYCYVIEKE